MNLPQSDAAFSGNHIPYAIRSQINQIDPKLDIFWRDYLLAILKELPENQRKNIVVQLLKPKGIYWSSAEKTFEYRPDTNEQDSLGSLISDIPPRLAPFQTFAKGITRHLKNLQEYESVEQIADFLENILEKIHDFPSADDLELHALKQRLHTQFIYACAALIRQKDNLILPPNHRGLNTHIIKTFINEIYLKHQLLGYWFKTVSSHQLAEMPQSLLSGFLRREQKIRQLEIIRTTRYLFAIAPSIESDANPFAIRRFLQEEALFSQSRVIMTGVALNPAMLAGGSSAEYEQRFRQQISMIITLESNVRKEVFDFLEELESTYETAMLPLLFTPFDAGLSIGKAVPARLQQYEQLANKHILEPLSHTLRHNIGNQDEFDVLYIGIRQIFGNILSTFKEFLELPALLMNEQADLLFGRLVAYTRFLEKRRSSLFIPHTPPEWDDAHQHSEQPQDFLRDTVLHSIGQYRLVQKEMTALQQQHHHNEPKLVDRLLKRREKESYRLTHLQQRLQQIQSQVYQSIIDLPKQHPNQVMRMEFDSPLMTCQTRRHYAFPAGDNGLSRLPIVINLPADGSHFNLSLLADEIEHLLLPPDYTS